MVRDSQAVARKDGEQHQEPLEQHTEVQSTAQAGLVVEILRLAEIFELERFEFFLFEKWQKRKEIGHKEEIPKVQEEDG